MTRVISIDCHKWINIIKISLWSLSTIGLGFGLYVGYDHTFNGYSPYFSADECKKVGPYYCYTEKDPNIFYIMLIVNTCNIISMWVIINWKFRLIELKCISKTTFVEDYYSNSDKIVSNKEYFETKEKTS